MRLKGLRDIRTHGTLARQGRLISVARNLDRVRSHEGKGGNISNGWSVELHIYPKQKLAKPRMMAPASLSHDLFLGNKVRLHQIEVIQDLVQEMLQAIAEGIPGAVHELERLKKRLAQLV